MNFLSEYDSDSQGETDTVLLSTAAERSVRQLINDGGKEPGPIIKKRKLELLNFLPQEIQNALTRGDSLYDSDEDATGDVGMSTRKSTVRSSLRPAIGKSLTSLLPKPTGNTADDSVYSSSNIALRDKKKPLRKQHMEEHDADDNDYVGNEYNDKSSGSAAFRNSSSFSAAPALSSAKEYDNGMNDITTAAVFQVQSFNDEASNSKTNKRKENRNIEQALLNGDIGVVESIGGVKEIDRIALSWDSQRYKEQKEREKLSSFNIDTGSSKFAFQPTKMQNRKHQINSLVFQAAKTELDLLDAKGSRLKTKFETQSKYGW